MIKLLEVAKVSQLAELSDNIHEIQGIIIMFECRIIIRCLVQLAFEPENARIRVRLILVNFPFLIFHVSILLMYVHEFCSKTSAAVNK